MSTLPTGLRGELVAHLEPLGQLERGDAPRRRSHPTSSSSVRLVPGREHDDGRDTLAEPLVRVADDGDVGDGRDHIQHRVEAISFLRARLAICFCSRVAIRLKVRASLPISPLLSERMRALISPP